MIARAQAALLICFLTGFASATTVISQADPNLLSTKVKELTEQSLKFKELQVGFNYAIVTYIYSIMPNFLNNFRCSFVLSWDVFVRPGDIYFSPLVRC